MPLSQALSKHRDKQEPDATDKKKINAQILKHTPEEKRNRITADVVLLQLILRDSFSIK